MELVDSGHFEFLNLQNHTARARSRLSRFRPLTSIPVGLGEKVEVGALG